MATNQKPPGTGDCGCNDNKPVTVTQTIINTERKEYCRQLDAAGGSVLELEEKYSGTKNLKKKKKTLFIWTEKNYQAIRNLDLTKGTALLQFNESIKDATTGFLKDNKTLSDNLKDIVKKMKDVVAKTKELHAAACDLKRCVDDGCNCSQKGILTGEWGDKCKGTNPKPENRCKEDCDKVKEHLEKLYSIPDTLSGAADTLYKSAADIVGIQVFSNVATLEELQKKLYEAAKKFEKHLADTAKKDQEEVKKAQDDFVKAVQEHAKAEAGLYDKRGDFTGLYNTAAFFCCPDCKCVDAGNCPDRICEICKEVQTTFCECPPPDKPKTGC